MARRATLDDVAAAAGVSVATVDRVLNGRARVREETARKVSEAAAAIGFHGAAVLRDRALAHVPDYHLGVVLQKERHAFYQDLATAIEDAARRDPAHRWRVTLRFVAGQSPTDYAEAIAAIAGRVQVLAATGIDHPDVTRAVAGLQAQGIPVLSLLSDFAQGTRETYLGTNNLKTGRTAGWLMHHVAPRPGKLAVFIGGHRFHGHELRETGFRSYIRQCAPQFELLETMINLETRPLTYEATLQMTARYPDLTGLYCAGGGMEGAIVAIREVGPPRPALIVHELTPESREGLVDGTVSAVLSTPLAAVASDVLSTASNALQRGLTAHPGQRFVAANIVTPENL